MWQIWLTIIALEIKFITVKSPDTVMIGYCDTSAIPNSFTISENIWEATYSHSLDKYPLDGVLVVYLGVPLLLLHVLLLPAAVDEDLLHDVAPQLLVEGEHNDHEAEK